MPWGILKKSSLLLGFTMLFLSANVSAIGDGPVISHLKTGEDGFASHEFIAIYNNSENEIDVTGWCLYYASASNLENGSKIACLNSGNENIRLYLNSFSYSLFSTADFKQSLSGFQPDVEFSLGISGTSGHIRLFDADGLEVDKLGWGSALSPELVSIATHSSGKILARKHISNTDYLQDINNNSLDFQESLLSQTPTSGLYEVEQDTDLCTNIAGSQSVLPDDFLLNSEGLCQQDQCDNLDGLQEAVPEGFSSQDGENCIEQILIFETSLLSITELLPNATSVDTGFEFVEIHNPNNKAVNLKDYKLELGPGYSKIHIFDNYLLDPLAYVSFSDLITGITLPNGSADLRLKSPTGQIVSQTETYSEPKDDEAWALINDVWQYTSVLTPGAVNKSSVVVSITSSTDDELEDCGPGRFRNPETNRCKAITTGDQELKPCETGQTRNPETNRCRAQTAASSLVPCKAGQTRNPETNRCRSIVSTASALKPCSPGQERNPATNRCRKIQTLGATTTSNVQDVPTQEVNSLNLIAIAAVVIAAMAYAAYEWRAEISRYLSSLYGKLTG